MTRRVICWLVCALAVAAAHDEPIVRITSDGLDKHRPAWFPDGKRITFAREDADGSHIWQYVMEPSNPSSLKRLTDRKAGVEYNAAISPEGKRLLLVVISLSGTQGNLDIALLKADGTDLKIVAGDEGGKLSHQDWPSWSPDGKRFAFSSTHEGNQEIYVANEDGSHRVRLTQSPGQDAHPCWSPDGKRIAFATDRWGGLELASVSPDGSGLVRLTESAGLDDYPAYSPDSRSIAFVSNRDGQFEVYLASADGTNTMNVSRSPARDTFPTWTPDASTITWVSNRTGGAEIFTRHIVDVGR
jgi:TolB protein